jgi:hypothetical protein
LFRLRLNGMVTRRLLSWGFDRLTVPPAFRLEARINEVR